MAKKTTKKLKNAKALQHTKPLSVSQIWQSKQDGWRPAGMKT